jgi:hypothetical protein
MPGFDVFPAKLCASDSSGEANDNCYGSAYLRGQRWLQNPHMVSPSMSKAIAGCSSAKAASERLALPHDRAGWEAAASWAQWVTKQQTI